LTITLVRQLPLFKGTPVLKKKCAELVSQSYRERLTAIYAEKRAKECFVSRLGLENWQPSDALSCTRRASEVFLAKRLDAEHYQEKFYAARQRLRASGAIGFVPFDKLLSEITNGHTPLHHDLREGEVPFLCAEHVADFEITYESDKHINLSQHKGELARTALKNGDVLLTIKGRIGNTALVENVDGPLNINQDVALLRFNDRLPVWFVLAFLNSPFGKLQVQQMSTGGINPFLGLSNVRQLLVPEFEKDTMIDIGSQTRKLVLEARTARKSSRSLLHLATKAVETAIANDQDEALTLLKMSLK
jgi:hypothetical protein